MDDLLSKISTVLKRQDFRMCVPPESDDTDIVLEECRDAIESLRQQLAAALAACEAKDAEVKEMRSGDPEYVYYACKRILAIQPDASVLKAHDVALIERCAEVCEEYVDRIEAKRDEEYQAEYAGRQAGATRCAAAIRELKERK